MMSEMLPKETSLLNHSFNLSLKLGLTKGSPGGSTSQSSSCTVPHYPLRKLSKLDKPDMRDTAGEVGTDSEVTCSYGPVHMDKQK